MQQLNIFSKPIEEVKPEKPIQEKVFALDSAILNAEYLLAKPDEKNIETNEIFELQNQIKPIVNKTKTEPLSSLELIEKIKAKLKKEFDLTTPVERNDAETGKPTIRNVEANSEISFTVPINIPADEDLYKKQYYTMGETAAMLGISQPMLRLWENEFDILKPKKNKKGNRYFRPIDIKNLELIYHLLRQRKFTLQGAKAFLKQKNQRAVAAFAAVQKLEKLKIFLVETKNNL